MPDCGRRGHKTGLCWTHYNRTRSTSGKPVDRPVRAMGAGHLASDGYRRIAVSPGEYAMEHRVLVERAIGRKLAKGENVHHRNGQRADNSVGPCVLSRECRCEDGRHNLELWITPPRPGQRVADHVAWATDILQRYAPQLLATER